MFYNIIHIFPNLPLFFFLNFPFLSPEPYFKLIIRSFNLILFWLWCGDICIKWSFGSPWNFFLKSLSFHAPCKEISLGFDKLSTFQRTIHVFSKVFPTWSGRLASRFWRRWHTADLFNTICMNWIQTKLVKIWIWWFLTFRILPLTNNLRENLHIYHVVVDALLSPRNFKMSFAVFHCHHNKSLNSNHYFQYCYLLFFTFIISYYF